jgi:hypothetical protein
VIQYDDFGPLRSGSFATRERPIRAGLSPDVSNIRPLAHFLRRRPFLLTTTYGAGQSNPIPATPPRSITCATVRLPPLDATQCCPHCNCAARHDNLHRRARAMTHR